MPNCPAAVRCGLAPSQAAGGAVVTEAEPEPVPASRSHHLDMRRPVSDPLRSPLVAALRGSIPASQMGWYSSSGWDVSLLELHSKVALERKPIRYASVRNKLKPHRLGEPEQHLPRQPRRV